jgi:4-hydroxy-tetrahydrodipicolinate reductase
MNLLIIGYGKMGKSIEIIAKERGHNIAGIIDVDNQSSLKDIDPPTVDVAIEFSQPDAAYENIRLCLEGGIKILSGTTGWLNRKEEVKDLCNSNSGTFFYASNYSIGVNLFFRLNKYLANLIKDYPQYRVNMTEIHHTEKKDAPSGTAISLADDIISAIPGIKKWEDGNTTLPESLSIKSERTGEVPGTHIINYVSEIDQIEIKHEAFSRKGFALGAVLVAEWLKDKEGMLDMNDFLEI